MAARTSLASCTLALAPPFDFFFARFDFQSSARYARSALALLSSIAVVTLPELPDGRSTEAAPSWTRHERQWQRWARGEVG